MMNDHVNHRIREHIAEYEGHYRGAALVAIQNRTFSSKVAAETAIRTYADGAPISWGVRATYPEGCILAMWDEKRRAHDVYLLGYDNANFIHRFTVYS